MIPAALPHRYFACAAMALALFLSAGGHWAMLQGVAWTGMVTSYSKSGSVVEALGKTFDGNHPCPLCKKITSARAQEQSAPATVKVEKKAAVYTIFPPSLPLPPVSRPFAYGPVPPVVMPERCVAPPVPVPRRA